MCRRLRLIIFFIPLFGSYYLLSQSDTAYQSIMAMPNDTIKLDRLYELSKSFLYSDRTKTLAYVEDIYTISKKINNKKGRVKGDFLRATALHYDGLEDDALKLALGATQIAREEGFKFELSSLLNLLCQIYQSKYQLQKALDAILESLEISREIGEKEREAIAYHTIASTYHYLNELKTAQKYLEQAIPLFTELEDWYRLGVVYQSLAIVTTKEEALKYAQKGLEALLKTDDVQGQGMCYWSIGSAYYSLGDFSRTKLNYEKARDIFKEINFPEGLANIESNLGTLLVESKDYTGAFPHIDSAYRMASEHGFKDILPPIFKSYSKYYSATGNVPLALAFIDSLDTAKDSLFANEKTQTLIESEARLETRNKETQIATQQLEIEKSNNTRKNILIGSLLSILGISFAFFFFRSRQLKKQKDIDTQLMLERKTSEHLQQLDEIKSNFFANISHEFRTPLTLILGPLDQMRKGIFEGDYQKYYELMYRNGNRLLQLINQLLDLSKLENDKLQLQTESLDIYVFLRQITAAFESWTAQKNIDYQIKIPDSELWGHADKDKIEKIIVNLISNAIKYTEEYGKIQVFVQAELIENKQHIQIIVKDNGKGITPNDLSMIFDRFYQSGNHSDELVGSGIGLALTKELVQLHGGSINAESLEGMGSTFTVSLPIETAEPIYTSDSPVNLNSIRNVKSTIGSNRDLTLKGDFPRILIVEDNSDVRTYIKDHLQGNYILSEAENGAIGMQKVLEELPDLIISDVMMPKVDGIELVNMLKSNDITNHIPIILLTAKAGQNNKIEGLEVGADAYLTKPFDSAELKIRVQNLITQRRLLREKYKATWHIGPNEVVVQSDNEKFIEKIKDAIESNLDNEQFSVEDLATIVGFSRSQLNRKIKSLIDKSPSDMIREFRLIRAKSLIEQQAGTISEIAYQVGYANLSYFTKSFKKKFGVVPSEIRVGQHE